MAAFVVAILMVPLVTMRAPLLATVPVVLVWATCMMVPVIVAVPLPPQVKFTPLAPLIVV